MHAESYRIALRDDRDEMALDVIGPGLHAYNIQQAGDNDYQRLCVALYTPDDAIAGGLIGATYWNWLYVDLLWVPDELRGRGFGKRLLALAEEEARRRGAENAYLDTFTFQAPDFYEKQGYEVFGQLDGFPLGHVRYYMRKRL